MAETVERFHFPDYWNCIGISEIKILDIQNREQKCTDWEIIEQTSSKGNRRQIGRREIREDYFKSNRESIKDPLCSSVCSSPVDSTSVDSSPACSSLASVQGRKNLENI